MIIIDRRDCIETVKKAGDIYAQLRKKQDAGCILELDRQTAKHLKGETDD